MDVIKTSQKQVSEKTMKWVYGIIGVIVLLLIGGANSVKDLPAPEYQGNAPSQETDTKSLWIGNESYIKTNFPELVIATTKEGNDELSNALLANDSFGVADLVASGKAFVVENGVKVLIIDRDYAIRKIRILEGNQFNNTWWIPMEWLSQNK